MSDKKLTWRDLSDGATIAEKRGYNREKIMKEIRRHTDGMKREEERAFVTEFFDRSKS